ncbi:MAG: hypothetical protein EON88_20305 [Brevundimonas sp.]|nr:MAG: hypothetical protein EON88_20305 [Brevundimonas sp.]
MAVLLALIALPAVAAAQEPGPVAPPEGIVWMALRDINEIYFDADDPTDRPPLVTAAPQGMIRQVDISRDGRPDWLVDYEAAGQGAFCGTGGCLERLYVSTPDGLVRAFDQQAMDFQIVERDGEPRLDMMVHHLFCEPETWDCRAAFRWDAAARKMVPAAVAEGFAAAVSFPPLESEE